MIKIKLRGYKPLFNTVEANRFCSPDFLQSEQDSLENKSMNRLNY